MPILTDREILARLDRLQQPNHPADLSERRKEFEELAAEYIHRRLTAFREGKFQSELHHGI